MNNALFPVLADPGDALTPDAGADILETAITPGAKGYSWLLVQIEVDTPTIITMTSKKVNTGETPVESEIWSGDSGPDIEANRVHTFRVLAHSDYQYNFRLADAVGVKRFLVAGHKEG